MLIWGVEWKNGILYYEISIKYKKFILIDWLVCCINLSVLDNLVLLVGCRVVVLNKGEVIGIILLEVCL